jgi:Lrp/AsnC family leucine-responsive transcriptional regulator
MTNRRSAAARSMARQARPPAEGQPAADLPPLDSTDIEILGHLARDARLSQRAIARAIGVSAPMVADRINRMEVLGVIEGYRVRINFSLLDRGLTLVVGVTSERSRDQRELAQALLEIPEVERVDIATGPVDLQVRLNVRDQAHFNDVYFNQILAFSGIRHTDTALVLNSYEPANFTQQILASLPQAVAHERLAENE